VTKCLAGSILVDKQRKPCGLMLVDSLHQQDKARWVMKADSSTRSGMKPVSVLVPLVLSHHRAHSPSRLHNQTEGRFLKGCLRCQAGMESDMAWLLSTSSSNRPGKVGQ
jgi:hypothetical protein